MKIKFVKLCKNFLSDFIWVEEEYLEVEDEFIIKIFMKYFQPKLFLNYQKMQPMEYVTLHRKKNALSHIIEAISKKRVFICNFLLYISLTKMARIPNEGCLLKNKIMENINTNFR